jgi:hypothetical protein
MTEVARAVLAAPSVEDTKATGMKMNVLISYGDAVRVK